MNPDKPNSTSSKQSESGPKPDDVLRRMLNTPPPKPANKPKKAKKPAK